MRSLDGNPQSTAQLAPGDDSMRAARYASLKRAADFTLAALALPISLPLMGITAITVRLTLGSPVLFRQRRPGLHGEPFNILKFRTMQAVDVQRNLVTNEQRITKAGSFIRSTSLDELPSLINVLRGEMSLVGPRPLRMSYLPRYSNLQATRHSVRPGLTGLAQVSGRNSLSWDQRLDLDVQYVQNQSLALDAKILARTVLKVMRRDGVAAEGQASMSEYFGPETTEDLTLRPFAEIDIPTRVEWLSDERVRNGISISFWPTEEEMRTWYTSAQSNDCRTDYTAIDTVTQEPQAMCGFTDIREGSASLYIYVNPNSQAQGLGTQAMQLLLTRARQRGLSKLMLETKRTNVRAQRFYTRLGFIGDKVQGSPEKYSMHIVLD